MGGLVHRGHLRYLTTPLFPDLAGLTLAVISYSVPPLT
jgi:hypothetical protein